MSIIEITEVDLLNRYRKDWHNNLFIEKSICEILFPWLQLVIDLPEKRILGKGILTINNEKFDVRLIYSPFFKNRFDKIFIAEPIIGYDSKIHLYRDLSLCLYHPKFDKPLLKLVLLHQIIPWITEWCINYQEWKKYGVWLGREISH